MTDSVTTIPTKQFQDTGEFPPHLYPYRIRNWSKFQHYKKRNPPWVKLHISIMSSEDWVMLADASKLLAIVCMMIASKHEGYLPASASPSYFKRVAYLDQTPDFKPLIKCGFLENTLATASLYEQATARPEQSRAETEQSIIEEAPSPPAQAPSPFPVERWSKEARGQPRKGTRLPEDWSPSSEGLLFAIGLLGEEGAARQVLDFKDYWIAKAGKDALKLDWGRTWMKWCRKAKDWKGNGGSRPPSLKERTADALQRLGSGSLSETLDFGLPKLSPN